VDLHSARVSVVATEVRPGREDEFLGLVDELHALIRRRGYGSDRLLQDGKNPRLYYHVRTWSTAEAASRCADDPEVVNLWSKLDPTIRIAHLVGMARPVDLWASAAHLPAAIDRRLLTNRRSGGERRVLDLRPPGDERRGAFDRRQLSDRRSGDERRVAEIDRRSGTDRRTGIDRRLHATPPPGGVDRRDGDRRQADRRSGAERRASVRLAAAASADVIAVSEARLVSAARAARQRAIAPYSQFLVGAALETHDGTIITGCNVENASYGLTICAERVALLKALSEGHRHFRRLAVVADAERPTPPCGSCRQLVWEYCGDVEVVLANLTRETARHRMRDLLPHPFDSRHLDGPETA
jgi:cytidine deaminase